MKLTNELNAPAAVIAITKICIEFISEFYKCAESLISVQALLS